jgi:hypothetical protein
MHVRENIVARMLEKGAGWLGRKRLAQTSGQLHLPGVQSRVEIFRDRQGVPHIYAQNEHDLFYAQGFVHAQDRFWQMEFQRRLVAGRLSEIFGELALSRRPVDADARPATGSRKGGRSDHRQRGRGAGGLLRRGKCLPRITAPAG